MKQDYTQDEINLLRQLIRLRVKASERGDKGAAKRIRQQMRDIGFWGRDDFGIIDMQLSDLDRLIDTGQIKVNGMCQGLKNIEPTLTLISKTVLDLSINRGTKKRLNSDESYIIDLCDTVLGQKSSRQHTFDFLKGDPGNNGIGKKLPVDAYYDSLKLVVEFAERQHTEEVKFFDKPDKMTISGVNRGEQRKIYDLRRHQVLPQHGIRIITFGYEEFEYDRKKKLLRSKDQDMQIINKKLNQVR